jgi:hypothetical protein
MSGSSLSQKLLGSVHSGGRALYNLTSRRQIRKTVSAMVWLLLLLLLLLLHKVTRPRAPGRGRLAGSLGAVPGAITGLKVLEELLVNFRKRRHAAES